MGSRNWGMSVAAARSVLRLCLISRGTRHRDVEGGGVDSGICPHLVRVHR